MLGRFLLTGLFISLLDIWLLWKVAFASSFSAVFLWCFSSFLLGVWVIRSTASGHRLQGDGSAQTPQDLQTRVLRSIVNTTAGLLLIVPGFVTDGIGLLLLLPPVRNFFYKKLQNSDLAKRAHVEAFGFGGASPFGASNAGPQQAQREHKSQGDDVSFHDNHDDNYAPPSSQRPETVIIDAEIVDND